MRVPVSDSESHPNGVAVVVSKLLEKMNGKAIALPPLELFQDQFSPDESLGIRRGLDATLADEMPSRGEIDLGLITLDDQVRQHRYQEAVGLVTMDVPFPIIRQATTICTKTRTHTTTEERLHPIERARVVIADTDPELSLATLLGDQLGIVDPDASLAIEEPSEVGQL